MYSTVTQQNNLISWLHSANRTMQTIAVFTVMFYLVLILSPSAEVMAAQIGQTDSTQQNPETELSEAFAEAVEKLALLKQLRAEDKDTDVVLGQLSSLKSRIEGLDETIIENFTAIENDLEGKQLPAVILQRHTDMVNHYKTQSKAFMDMLTEETDTGLVSSVVRSVSNFISSDEISPDEAAGNSVTDGDTTFSTSDFKRSHQDFDPNNLPTKALQPDDTNKPKETKQEFIQSGLKSSPRMEVAALGDFTFNNLEEATDPLYLAESDEIQLTESIKAKAAELDHDAVKIYHWVRNNIEWLPSWGAIQDAELTLEAQRGNAMDIASLTISLLRASGIPARYVHGTIDVPVEKFNNWAGGFTSWEAAGNYASSAGIPITSIISGGQVSKMRMEHIWVEAATDFHPSRGAKNKDADTWVQLDPSYKRYEYVEGPDALAISGLDINQLSEDFAASGTINQDDGSVTNFDSTILQQAQAEAQSRLEEHLTTLDNPTVGDIIGGKKTIIKEFRILPSSLPNQIVTVGTRYDKLPSALQQKIEFAFNKDILGNLIDPISFPFAKLNNEKVTLSFKPATQSDEEALAAMIPEGLADISQLSNTIPSYLVNVIPELIVNGVTVKVGTGMSLGEEVPFTTGIRFAGRGYLSSPRTYKVIAGSYLHANVFAGSVSPAKVDRLQAKLTNINAILDSDDQTQISDLSRDDILGDMFHAAGLGYYGQLLSLSHINGLKSGGLLQMAAGYGTIGYEPEVNSFFGFPRSISTGGVTFDIPMINVITNKDGNAEKSRDFSLQVGTLSSALEHITPEQLFASPNSNDEPLDAISAVKALQKANAQGQKIYVINQENMSQVMPLLRHDSDTLSEIRASLSIGKEVTTHTDAVSIPGGWNGFGYIIVDPVVGDGAYKISGGANGGVLKDLKEKAETVLNWISILGKKLGKLGIIGKQIKKIIGQIKRFIKKISAIIDIISTCGAFSLAALPIFLGALFVAAMATRLLVGALSALSGIGIIVALVVGFVALPWALGKVNDALDSVADDLLSTCRNLP